MYSVQRTRNGRNEWSSYAKEIAKINEKAFKVGLNGHQNLYRLFATSFLVEDRDQKWSDWQKWHLYAYKRYLTELEIHNRNRPAGDSKNYGRENLFAICFHVGSKEEVNEFAQHVNEIETQYTQCTLHFGLNRKLLPEIAEEVLTDSIHMVHNHIYGPK